MATFLRTTVKQNIGTTPNDVLTPSANSYYTVIGCNLTNKTANEVLIDITILDPSLNEGYYIKNLYISPYTSAKIITNGEKLVLAGDCIMRIVSNTNNSIDAVISYAEIL